MRYCHLTEDEIRRLLPAIPDDRDRTAFLVGYLHGLRISEIIGLRVRDVQDGYLTVQRLKGSLRTTQPLFAHSDLGFSEVRELENIILTNRLTPKDRLFPRNRLYFDRLFKRVGPTVGIPFHKCHMHVLKHSIAKRLVGSISIEELRQYLGHTSLNSTGAYLKVTDEVASQAVMKAFSK